MNSMRLFLHHIPQNRLTQTNESANFYLPLNIQIAPYTARIMIKYKNMMLYMLVNNYLDGK